MNSKAMSNQAVSSAQWEPVLVSNKEIGTDRMLNWEAAGEPPVKVRCTSPMIGGRYVGYWDGTLDSESRPVIFFPYATACIIVERVGGWVYRLDMAIPWTFKGDDEETQWVFDYSCFRFGTTLMRGCCIPAFNWRMKVLEQLDSCEVSNE